MEGNVTREFGGEDFALCIQRATIALFTLKFLLVQFLKGHRPTVALSGLI